MYKILSIDGGGVRGLIPTTWLTYLEEQVGPLKFDMYAGTSSGAITAAGMAYGSSAKNLCNLYLNNSSKIFPGWLARTTSQLKRIPTQGFSMPKYDGVGLNQILLEAFADTEIGDIQTPLLVTAFDTLDRKAVVFKQTNDKYIKCKLRDIVRASCSAPTYFPAHKMQIDEDVLCLIDGVVVSNNPVMCAIAEAIRLGVPREEIVVVSLGTGSTAYASDASNWGTVEWIPQILNMIIDGNATAMEYIGKHIMGQNYYRIQVPIKCSMEIIDNSSNSNLRDLMLVANNHIIKEKELFNEVARILSVS